MNQQIHEYSIWTYQYTSTAYEPTITLVQHMNLQIHKYSIWTYQYTCTAYEPTITLAHHINLQIHKYKPSVLGSTACEPSLLFYGLLVYSLAVVWTWYLKSVIVWSVARALFYGLWNEPLVQLALVCYSMVCGMNLLLYGLLYELL